VYILPNGDIGQRPQQASVLQAHRLHILLALAAACLCFYVRSAMAVHALAQPAAARSSALGAVHDAAIALDEHFAHTYSRAQLPLSSESKAQRRRQQALQGSKHVHGSQAVGDEWNWQKNGFTRCSQAAIALSTYFCGSGAANTARSVWQEGVRALESTLDDALSSGAQAILELHIIDSEDESFGHVFSMRTAADSSVKLYMSYINQYTLGGYMRRHPLSLSVEELLDALSNLRVLEQASNKWTPAGMRAYEELFDVQLEEKKAAGTISLFYSVVCVVPPFNGTAADFSEQSHQEHVQLLLQKPLRSFSLQ
jgi:hypothetical protein